MIRPISLIISAIFFFQPAAWAESNPVPLSLKQCIALALKNNVDLLLARAREGQAKGQETMTTSALLPQIDAVASQQRTWWENFAALGFPSAGTVGPFNAFNAGIMVSQRILDFSAMAHAQAGKRKTAAYRLEVQLASQQVVLATGLAYVQALGYQEQLASSYEDVRLAQRFLSLSLHQLNAGLASAVDVARERTQLAQQKARQEQIKLNVVKSQLELKRLIRLPLSKEIILTDSLTEKSYNYLKQDEAVNLALQDRLEMKVAHAEIDYSSLELKAGRNSRLPKVSLRGEFGSMGLTPTSDDTHAANAMISLSLPIWEGGRVAGEIKEKEGLNLEQEIKADDLNWKIEEDVRVSLETLSSSASQLEALQQVVDLAQQELRLAQDRFTAGLGDNIQLIDAQDALADAKDKYVQSLMQLNQAQLNYFGALGAPQEFELKKG